MTVGGAFICVSEKGRVNDEQRSRVYNAVRYIAFFARGPDDRVIMELQCSF